MNITVHTLAYNEEIRIQFMIDHYRTRFPNCNIVIYDNYSTDKTAEIAKQNNCEIRTYDSKNKLNDGVHAQVKNNCWKNAKTDWVLICDLDELLDITEKELEFEENNGTTIIKAEAWTLVNMEDNYDLKNMKYGIRDGGYDKNILFNKKYIKEINYGVGCHNCNPIGTVKFGTKQYIMYHYRDINPDFTISRSKSTTSRLSDANKMHKWGLQCMRSEDELRKDYARLRSIAKEVPMRHITSPNNESVQNPIEIIKEEPQRNVMKHFYQNIQGWFNYQGIYSDIVKKLPNRAHIVEIGAWKGCSTSYLAVEIINSGKQITLDVIDLWNGDADGPKSYDITKEYLNLQKDVLTEFKRNLSSVLSIINLNQILSIKAAQFYCDQSLDFVFIDASPEYECVKQDINAFLPKIKSGGFIGGHDYNPNSFPGVIKAVNEKFTNNVKIIGDSWLVQVK